jgi:hypothetical protein
VVSYSAHRPGADWQLTSDLAMGIMASAGADGLKSRNYDSANRQFVRGQVMRRGAEQ